MLKDKLIAFYVQNQLPQEPTVHKHLDNLMDARNAI